MKAMETSVATKTAQTTTALVAKSPFQTTYFESHDIVNTL